MAHRNRVLVIEDDQNTRRQLCELLRQVGYRAESTHGTGAAPDHVGEPQPVAVLIDSERCSPENDPGLAELRRSAPSAAIVVTAHANRPHAILQALRTAADAYLLTPSQPEDLATTLEKLAAEGPGESGTPTGSRFRSLFEGAACGALILAHDTCDILQANRTAELLLGCRGGTLDSQSVSRFVHPEDRPAFHRLYDRLVSGRAGSLCLHSRMIDYNGQPLPTRLTLATVPDKHQAVDCIAALIEPPSTVPQQESPVRDERDALWNATHDAVIRTDLTGSITAWNPAAERAYGYTAAEALGKPLTFLLPPDRQGEPGDILRGLREGHHIEPWHTTHLGRDGQPRELCLTCRAIRDAKGRPTAALFVGHDLTRQHTLEQRLLETSTCEQRRIGQDFHDGLGQELTGIAFLARSLHDQLAEDNSPHAESAEQIVHYINETITHAKALVKGLRPAALEGRGIVHALRDLAEAATRTHRIECEIEADESLQVDDPDTATHLYYIAREAVNNAVHHGRAARICIRLQADDDCLRLCIRDNGVGLAADGPQNPGSGMDIMNCRAQMIGGSLHVRGAAQRGTEVHCAVDLPITPASTTGR